MKAILPLLFLTLLIGCGPEEDNDHLADEAFTQPSETVSLHELEEVESAVKVDKDQIEIIRSYFKIINDEAETYEKATGDLASESTEGGEVVALGVGA